MQFSRNSQDVSIIRSKILLVPKASLVDAIQFSQTVDSFDQDHHGQAHPPFVHPSHLIYPQSYGSQGSWSIIHCESLSSNQKKFPNLTIYLESFDNSWEL